jgi:NACHT domain- and WD repeat-containing protein
MAPSSRTGRVLVGSMLRDLTEEREVFRREVFPKLQDLYRRRGFRLQAIELNWGSGIRELDRSRSLTPPAYICVLGERRGPRPLPEAIPAAEFAEIEKHVPSGSIAFLREWYRLDHNAIPPVAVLQRPGGVFSQPAAWERFVAAPLHELLAQAARGLGLAPEARLKYEASAAEQEIEATLKEKDGARVRVHCFSRVSPGTPPDPDLEALRNRIRQLGGNCYEYDAKTPGALAALALTALARGIEAEVRRPQKPAAADAEAAAHEAFGRERAHGFTGRAKAVERIAQYLHGADTHPLVIAGPPGSGKSALLAHSVERYRTVRPEAAVIYRAAGATAESLDGRALLAGVCGRLGKGALESTGYADLVEQLPERLKASAAGAGVAVVLDGLDQWEPLDPARDLDWLPANLPAGVRLVVATASGELLARLRKKVPAGNIVELEAMEPDEGGRLLDIWLGERGRTLTVEQRARVLGGFLACPQPLYLKLSFEEARHWRSNSQTASPAPDLAGHMDRILERLAARHGRPLVARCFGYLAAARHGLAEDELFDLLSRDGLLQPDAWPPLCADLEPYLMERASGGDTLLAFAHKAFAEAAAQAFLAGDERSARHQALASYFAESGFADRRLWELARQQAQGEMWAPLEATLTSYEFADAKVRAGLLRDLIDDHRVAETCWRASKRLSPPWHEWSRFLTAEARTIESKIEKYPQILFQQALNRSREGRVSRAAQALVKEDRAPSQPWFERVNRPELPPPQACVATFEGHRGPVSSMALAEGGSLAISGGADGTLRVWRVATGACVHILRGHTAGIMAVATAGADRVVSASWDSTVRVWNLDSGECVQVLGGGGVPVLSLAAVGTDRVAAGAADGSLRLWEIASGKALASLVGHKDRINSILALGGGRLASASDDGSVHVWSEDGSSLGALTGHDGPVLHLSSIAGGLSASCRSGKVVLWDVETARPRDTMRGHTGAVAGSAPVDAARMVSWSYDGTVRYWSLVDGSQLALLRRHQGPVMGVAVLEDGRTVSASQDSTLRLWDSQGEPLGVLTGHRSWVNFVAAGAGRLVSASRDGTVKVWDLDAVGGEHPIQPVEMPSEIVRSRTPVRAYVVDPVTAISVAGDPECWQLWDLAAGRCVQSVAGDSETGEQLRKRVRGRMDGPGPSYCGKPLSEWGFAIRGVAGVADELVPGLALTRERQRHERLFDYETGALAFYPLVCRPASWTFACECAIAFDARTNEPHIVRAHLNGAAEPEESPASGGLLSMVRKFLGRGADA